MTFAFIVVSIIAVEIEMTRDDAANSPGEFERPRLDPLYLLKWKASRCILPAAGCLILRNPHLVGFDGLARSSLRIDLAAGRGSLRDPRGFLRSSTQVAGTHFDGFDFKTC